MAGLKENGLVPVTLSGGKRANIGHANRNGDMLDGFEDWDWWEGWGKSEGCNFEGPWVHLAILAAKILRHPNTAKVAPNLHVELPLTKEQEESY